MIDIYIYHIYYLYIIFDGTINSIKIVTINNIITYIISS